MRAAIALMQMASQQKDNSVLNLIISSSYPLLNLSRFFLVRYKNLLFKKKKKRVI